jgi:hypothetical protein
MGQPARSPAGPFLHFGYANRPSNGQILIDPTVRHDMAALALVALDGRSSLSSRMSGFEKRGVREVITDVGLI